MTPHRISRLARACAGVLIVGLLSACGGGGGGSSSSGTTPVTPPTPVPITGTPAPGTLSVPGRQSSGGGAGGFVNNGTTPSSYTVTSNPTGLAFTVGGASYTTPATVSPAASTNALAIAFPATNFSVPIVQVYDGPHSVYYNQLGDSSGTVALTSLQSIRRSTASVARQVLPTVRRGVRSSLGRRLDIDPTRVAVRLAAAALRTSGRSPSDVERAVGAVGRATQSATADSLEVVNVPAGTDAAAFTAKLQAQPEVAEVTPIHRRYLQARAATTVSDPGFNIPDQWNTFATGANFAWSYNPGTGSKIAIVDTGVDQNNTDLADQLAYSETDVTPIDPTTCLPTGSATTVRTPNTAQDDNGHGTDVAGIGIAQANTAGFAGAAWGARLIAFKIFPTQTTNCSDTGANYGADTSDEAVAIGQAVAQGADVISLSLGGAGGSADTVEFNAIQSAIAAGVTVVAAAGNGGIGGGDEDGSGAGTLDYPAAFPGVISVGASALKDQYSGVASPPANGTYATATEYVPLYSQYAPSLSVVAPGGDASGDSDGDLLHWIYNYTTSTAFQAAEQCSTPVPATSCVALFNGTSMATPQVAGAAAMLIAEAGGHGKLTPAQVKYAIESTADSIADPHQGHGRLNAYRALASLIRDTSAYSGPTTEVASTTQLVAFAYKTGNTNKPAIIDASFPAGIPVAANGSFRVGDVAAATGAYRVAVWYDANGDGVIDAGDQAGVAAVKCSSTAPCALGTITLHPVASGFYLP